MNVITGFPRSGSTLLCNILNQNPKFYASTTSVLAVAVANVQLQFSNTMEYGYELDRNREHAEKKLLNGINGLIDGYYYDKKGKTIFDKSRAWINHMDLLDVLNPQCKKIILIRDIRNVIASIEKQNRRTALFRKKVETFDRYVSSLINENTLVGCCVDGLQSFLQRKSRVALIQPVPDIGDLFSELKTYNSIILKYEQFVEHPQMTLKILYEFLQEKPFEHDFDNINNTAKDPDGLYLHKYPHQGCGKVEKSNLLEYHNFMSKEIINKIVKEFIWFYEQFGYPK